jgi:hypothetical protein
MSFVRWLHSAATSVQARPDLAQPGLCGQGLLADDQGMTLPDLSKPERALWEAFPRGAWVDVRSGDPEQDDPGSAGSWGALRTVRGEVVTALLLGACEPEPGRFPAVRLRGARIVGRIDLMGAVISHALVLEYCWFEEALRFVETTTKTVRITGSRLPAFNGARMRTEGIVNFYQCGSIGPVSTVKSRCAARR